MAITKTSEISVLAHMISSGVESRIELCNSLKLSKATATHVVTRLLKKGFIEEGAKFSNSGRGRKTTALRVRPGIAYFLGTDLEGTAVRACLLDCQRNIIASGKRAIGPEWSKPKITRQWISLIENILQSSGIDRTKVVGLGVGLPGVISQRDFSTRAFLPPGKWIDFDVNKALSTLGFKITVANNVSCVSEYERQLGMARGLENFISVLIRYGIGASIYSNGSLTTSDKMSTGELGHMRLDMKGTQCICGRRGCLDVFASGRTWKPQEFTTANALEKELKKRARFLGVGLANLIKLCHLPLILINGIYNEYEDIVKPVLRQTLDDELTVLKLPAPEVVFAGPEELKTSIGAAMWAADFLEEYLKNHLFSQNSNEA